MVFNERTNECMLLQSGALQQKPTFEKKKKKKKQKKKKKKKLNLKFYFFFFSTKNFQSFNRLQYFYSVLAVLLQNLYHIPIFIYDIKNKSHLSYDKQLLYSRPLNFLAHILLFSPITIYISIQSLVNYLTSLQNYNTTPKKSKLLDQIRVCNFRQPNLTLPKTYQ
eukprot:TRINITY_DN12501_c0_g2_i1.p2 TRINITY_DN12501_c0_g2~~TRINITY_DN12501_c0_g2_i1.p2  ORF type:complete len:165 (+),score=1.28 TRINITY_DN12501_c0_g2_i1:856-1350(+)